MRRISTMDWTALAVPRCELAESPRYAHGGWTWLDIKQRRLYRLKQKSLLSSPLQRVEVIALPDEIACVLPTSQPDLWMAYGRQGAWRMQANQLTLAMNAPFDSTKHRFNDGRADSAGRAWVSSLVDARQPATAALYRMQHGQAKAMVDGLIVGNGLAFSPCNRWLYLTDTRQRAVWRYAFDLAKGELGQRELLHTYTEGTERPDGAVVSADGSYWVAVIEGYRLDRFNAAGTLVEQVELPLARPTMPCLGGPHGDEMMVCSAQPDLHFPNRPGFEQVSLIAARVSAQALPENQVV
ncbi:SMP-30/gluconolactonase/LRE family protein [Limnobacter sp.]|uniref:SMP-30/gluconolactonase/LRE family protein n=1 Tax=Limnobacter sp. TaxID=2003368 RepID=UPI002E3114AC|nr:SMP-30/gluconolactonase/LRE family protein [Limnobacter sp.]